MPELMVLERAAEPTTTGALSTEVIDGLPSATPFFVISTDRLVENVELFARAFPSGALHYAVKANSEPEVLKALAGRDIGFEVASAYELDLLADLSVAPERMIYGSSVKPADHIGKAAAYGVARFAADSPGELEKISEAAPESTVYIRVKVDDAQSVFRFSEKFGAEVDTVRILFAKAKALGLDPDGLSFHVGSQAGNAKAWANSLRGLQSLILGLSASGSPVRTLNIGGGFPCRYASSGDITTLDEIAEYTLEEFNALPGEPQLILEPGRAIVGDAACLVASVIARIEREEHTWLFLDAGCYNGLFEAMAYQGRTRYEVARVRPSDSPLAYFALAGPTGDSPDVVDRDVALPLDTAVGDKLMFSNVGAYSISMTVPFNGFPKPTVYCL